MKNADFVVSNNGSTWSFKPVSEAAKKEVELMGIEGWQWIGKSFHVDHRLASQLADQLRNDGFDVQ